MHREWMWYRNTGTGDVSMFREMPDSKQMVPVDVLNAESDRWSLNYGSRPLPPVDAVLYRDGRHYVLGDGEFDLADWSLGGGGSDIVAYRLAALPVQMVEPAGCALDVQVGGSHYKDMVVQPWQAIDAWFSREQAIGYYVGTAIAYLARINSKAEGKGGEQDIRKAHHTLTKLVEVLDGGAK